MRAVEIEEMIWKAVENEMELLLKAIDDLNCSEKAQRLCKNKIIDHFYMGIIPKLSTEMATHLQDTCKPCLKGIEPPRRASDWLGVLGMQEASKAPGGPAVESNEDLEPKLEVSLTPGEHCDKTDMNCDTCPDPGGCVDWSYFTF